MKIGDQVTCTREYVRLFGASAGVLPARQVAIIVSIMGNIATIKYDTIRDFQEIITIDVAHLQAVQA